MAKFFGMTFEEEYERLLDEEIPQHRARKTASKNHLEMENRVKAIAERDRARRPGHNPEVRVSFVDPRTL